MFDLNLIYLDTQYNYQVKVGMEFGSVSSTEMLHRQYLLPRRDQEGSNLFVSLFLLAI